MLTRPHDWRPFSKLLQLYTENCEVTQRFRNVQQLRTASVLKVTKCKHVIRLSLVDYEVTTRDNSEDLHDAVKHAFTPINSLRAQRLYRMSIKSDVDSAAGTTGAMTTTVVDAHLLCS